MNGDDIAEGINEWLSGWLSGDSVVVRGALYQIELGTHGSWSLIPTGPGPRDPIGFDLSVRATMHERGETE